MLQLQVMQCSFVFVQIDEGGNAIPLGEKAKARISNILKKDLEPVK